MMFIKLFTGKCEEAEIKAKCATALAIDAHERIEKILGELRSAVNTPKELIKAVKNITRKDSKGDWVY